MTATDEVQVMRNAEKFAIEMKQRDQAQWLMENVKDWEVIPIPIRAMILQQKPWKTKDGDMYMTYGQALGAVLYCARRGVDENSEEFWYDPVNKRYNLSSEGELAYARHRGFRWSIPKYLHFSRDWKESPSKPIQGFPMEPGCTCTFNISSSFGEEEVSATVWLGEWYVPTNPNWTQRTSWMLEVRSLSNNIKRATGAAISANLADGTIVIEQEETVQADPKLLKATRPEEIEKKLKESIEMVKK